MNVSEQTDLWLLRVLLRHWPDSEHEGGAIATTPDRPDCTCHSGRNVTGDSVGSVTLHYITLKLFRVA